MADLRRALASARGRGKVVVLAFGLLTVGAALGLAAAASPKFVGVSSATVGRAGTIEVTRPAVSPGDLMLAAIEVRQARGGRITAPSGWHRIRRDRAAARRGAALVLALYYKAAGEGEPSSYRWGLSGTAAGVGAIVAYRGVDATSPIAASSGHASHNVRLIRAPRLRHRPAGSIVVGFFGHSGLAAVTPPARLRERLDRGAGRGGSSLRLESVDGSGRSLGGGKHAKSGHRERLAVGQLVALRTAGSAPPPGAPCGGSSHPAQYAHVVWILFENHPYSSIIGSSSAPYFNRLASVCGLATNYSAIRHPSLPNYIALTSGSTQGITDDGGPSQHPLNVPSIFSQLRGGASRSLQESMPSNCALNNSSRYLVRHNPEAYYTNIRSECSSYDVPLGSTADISARFTFVTPNACNDMHDCSVSTGDTWLSHFLPTLLASSQYRGGKTAIFITFDEGSGGNNKVVTLAIAPAVHPGARSGTAYTHYSLLRTTEEMLGLGLLGNAGSAPSMRGGFGI